jgi:hypothetical protein
MVKEGKMMMNNRPLPGRPLDFIESVDELTSFQR